MVDRLIATESLSQGAQGIRFVPDIMDEFCMRQIAMQPYAKEVRSIFYGSDGRQVEATEPICQGARAPGCCILQINN